MCSPGYKHLGYFLPFFKQCSGELAFIGLLLDISQGFSRPVLQEVPVVKDQLLKFLVLRGGPAAHD